jgi:cytochrome c oxidase subunit II
VNKTKNLLRGILMSAVFRAGMANADYTLNMPVGVTKISREVHDLHMLVIWICFGIGLVVFGVMFYSFYHHRKSKGAVAASFHENGMVEILWTLIPFIILISMAIPATRTMMDLDDTRYADMTIKVTGYQWKWRYDYIDEGFGFMSQLDAQSNAARQLGADIDPATVEHYLLNVDRPLVIPVNKKVRFLFTAADVLHSWWVPELGWKKDTVPGFINESWTLIEKPGTYRGQCAELCGRDHGFMPIVVIAKSEEDYSKWLAEQKAANQAGEDASERTWTKDELIAKGEEIYNGNCASCHQANGEGIPGTFPAIKGSPVAAGPVDQHIDVVLNGKGAMMPAFAAMLPAADLAAVITYQRNGFGNNAGDMVQPADIAALVKAPADEDEDE